MTCEEVLEWLAAHANPEFREGMVRFGIDARLAVGVRVVDLRRLAREIGRDHALALELYRRPVHEGRILASMIADPALLPKLESVAHPLVTASRDAFAAKAAEEGRPFVVYDIPLLFETGADKACDVVFVVSTSPEIQKQRVLARPGMDEAALTKILSRQMPDAEKRRRAHFLVDTSRGIEPAERQVRAILRAVAFML